MKSGLMKVFGQNQNKPFIFGNAKLFERTDLKQNEKYLVPKHDPSFIVSKQILLDWEDMAVGLSNNDNIYLGGPVGSGKTQRVLELASILNQPVKRVPGNGDFKASHYLGKMVGTVDEKGNPITAWKDGVLTQCIKNDWWILIDEYDAIAPEIHFILRPVLERQPFSVSENFGEIIDPNDYPHFRILVTANTFGRGDETGLYTGTNIQNEADLDRYETTLEIGYPEPHVEEEIVNAVCNLDEEMISNMVRIANSVRERFNEEGCNCTFSTRRLKRWATKTMLYGGDFKRAATVTFLNKFDKEDKAFVSSLIQRFFGGENVR